eukprot:TRINITY_DN10194_c0_g1_i5.p2 TRINITY_DN10194_c0_g1~~TRINITY_DN10194_c0_g1_i5.p2  ORF type:complete len:126 (+),score=6.07 TRINITY_DN10194_c0_g1_i5:116-493(+)
MSTRTQMAAWPRHQGPTFTRPGPTARSDSSTRMTTARWTPARPISTPTTSTRPSPDSRTEPRGGLRAMMAGTFGVQRSLVARLVRDEKVGGSNPLTPTSISLSEAATCGDPPKGGGAERVEISAV